MASRRKECNAARRETNAMEGMMKTFSKLTRKLLGTSAASALLLISNNAMAFGADQSDDLKQAVMITVVLVGLFFLIRRRMEY